MLIRGGSMYFITFTDDCSRFTHVYLLKKKDETFNVFKTYKAEVENQLERKIKVLRSDKGGEYFSNDFKLFCEGHGIIYECTVPYAPQQNGIVEMKNRTFLEMLNVMLFPSKLSFSWWG